MKGVLIRSLVSGKKEIEPKVSFEQEDISETREVGNLSQAGCILTCACSCEQAKRQRAVGSCERPRRLLDRFGGRIEVGASSPREGGRVHEKEVHRKFLKDFRGERRVRPNRVERGEVTV